MIFDGEDNNLHRKKVNAKETRCSSGFLFAYSKVENHIVTMV